MSTLSEGASAEETTAERAKAAQRQAIEDSGWGVPFTFVQLRNACFWVYVVGMVAGILQLVRFYGPGLEAYAVGLGSGIVLLALYTVPWLLLLNYHNRYTFLPAKPLLLAFLWGAIPATYFLGLQANTAILGLYAKLFGQEWTREWGPGLTAPFSEETAKATALVLLIGLAPKMIRSAYDGLIVGAFAGLGLQVSEDLLYVFNQTSSKYGVDQVGTAFVTVFQRGGAGLFQHVLFSAVFCAGLMWLLNRDGSGRRARGVLFMVLAMIIHGSWDDLAAIGSGLFGAAGILFMPILVAVSLVVLVRTFQLAAPREQGWMRALMTPEAERGVISEAELTALSGGFRTRRAFRRSLDGHRDRRTAEHVLAAAQDLARELARSGGRDTDRVAYARAEVARLRGGPVTDAHRG